MDKDFSFDTLRLNETVQELNKCYHGYNDALNELDTEMKKLEDIWGFNDKSLYNDFKDKYNEKLPRLKEFDQLIQSLISNLNNKTDDLLDSTQSIKNNFE